MRERLLRLAVSLYLIPFLVTGIVAGFEVGGFIARFWPWQAAGGFAAMLIVCAAVVVACIWLSALIAWMLMLAILLPAMRRWPARFTGFVFVGDARPPWYGRPFRWIVHLALRHWPLPGPAAHADAGRPARL
ncbi:MAG: hypothetical protein ACTHOH_00565 [Lysobacteraceae bacterium]